MRKMTHEELLARQEGARARSRLPFHVVLNNIRSMHNVGSIFRTCDGAGVGKLWLCGITGYPPRAQIKKTALGADETVAWEYRQDACTLLDELKKEGFQIVLLEHTTTSTVYQDFTPRAPVCLVVGNETEGIADEVVNHCDAAIEIEMAGEKNSLNVSVAFGIVAYHMRNRLLGSPTA
jgi:tRNA G18 (ribose-2'-O)-methylase SpoU